MKNKFLNGLKNMVILLLFLSVAVLSGFIIGGQGMMDKIKKEGHKNI